jgi:hypothetical protein
MLTGLKAVMTVLLLWTVVDPVAAIAGPIEDERCCLPPKGLRSRDETLETVGRGT